MQKNLKNWRNSKILAQISDHKGKFLKSLQIESFENLEQVKKILFNSIPYDYINKKVFIELFNFDQNNTYYLSTFVR